MGQALYRKYRSKKLAEIVGQEHITTALANSLKQGKFSHAYLFTGPRGTGKTSIARILAHELNGLPYDEKTAHLDIIEIDAASNRRIDEIRELRERVHNAPAAAKYKVYIIDEVHMLTREAFNALLKTLEEPPEHAIFILATTEAHKLPETIISRTQRYTFRPIEKGKVVEHLRTIAKAEKVNITDDALELIADHGEGSFRDSISLLDQLRHYGQKVTLETVQQSLGIAPADSIQQLVGALAQRSPQLVLEQLKQMQIQGYHAPQIAKQLAAQLRAQLINGQLTLERLSISQLLRQLLEVPAAHDPQQLLEISLLDASLADDVPAELKSPKTEPGKVDKTLTEPTKSAKDQSAGSHSAKTIEPSKSKPESESKTRPGETAKTNEHAIKSSTPEPTGLLDDQSWQKVLQAIKARHNTLYSVARMAIPTFSGDELILTFSFPFHQKRLNDAKNRQVISDVITETTGQTVTINCVVDLNARSLPAAISQPSEPDPALESISNIFGGGEVLE